MKLRPCRVSSILIRFCCLTMNSSAPESSVLRQKESSPHGFAGFSGLGRLYGMVDTHTYLIYYITFFSRIPLLPVPPGKKSGKHRKLFLLWVLTSRRKRV